MKILVRSLSGLVYIIVIVGCICMGMRTFTGLCILLATMASIEFSSMTGPLSLKRLPLIMLDAIGCVSLALFPFIMPLLVWIVCMMARATLSLYDESERPLRSLAMSMLSQIWIGVPIGCMLATGEWFGLPMMVLAAFIIIWVNDTGAFLVGSLLGRHRLFERISPKKSWEGFWGGMCFSIGVAVLIGWIFNDFFATDIIGQTMNISLWTWAFMGALFCIVGTYGDLVESMIKRQLNLKDSSHLIPGHGGILDRIDSMLFVMPVLFIVILIIIVLC